MKISARLVSTKEDRLKSGRLKGGATLTLRLEGIRKSKGLLGRPVTIKVFEVDREKWNRNGENLLAVYSARIAEKQFTDAKRTWPEEPELLPGPEDVGYRFRPLWKPPHFRLSVEGGAADVVLLKGGSREREGYVYEIAFDVLAEGRAIFRSPRLTPTGLDCTNFLVENCRTAIETFERHQEEAIEKRGFGLHTGGMASLTDEEREAVEKYGIRATDCVTYLIDATRLGHEKTLASRDWEWAMSAYERSEARHRRTGSAGGSGMQIARQLVRMGWLGIYFNRDTRNPRDGLQYHKRDWEEVRRRRTYHGIRVTDTVVNYLPSEAVEYKDAEGRKGVHVLEPSEVTPEDRTNKYELLLEVPFGIVNLNDGVHTAMYAAGTVREAHHSIGPGALRNAAGERIGAPLFDSIAFEDYSWNSGFIVVPPGMWDKSKVTIRKD